MERLCLLFLLIAGVASAGTITIRWTYAYDVALAPQKPADHFLYGLMPCLPVPNDCVIASDGNAYDILGVAPKPIPQPTWSQTFAITLYISQVGITRQAFVFACLKQPTPGNESCGLPKLSLPGVLVADNSPEPPADVGATVVEIQKNLGIKSLSIMEGK